MKKIFIVLFLHCLSILSFAETIEIHIQNTTINVHFNVDVITKDVRYTFHTDAYIPQKYKDQFVDIVKKQPNNY
jgi:hypothetical protein